MVKNAFLWTLIGMISWSCFLGIRDDDNLTFVNRLKEGMSFLEKNVKEYNDLIIPTLNPEKNHTVSTMQEIAPQVVRAFAHIGSIANLFLILNSRIGCLISAIHSIGIIAMFNLLYLRETICKVMNV